MPISVQVAFRHGNEQGTFRGCEIAKFNPKELGEYWESLKNFRDWYSVMSTQLKKVLSKVVRKNASRMQKK